MKLSLLDRITLFLVILGALNWGFIGLFDFDLFSLVFDNLSVSISKVLYSVIGFSGLYGIFVIAKIK